ncbi:ATP-binding protein [Elusimicrobiota bacterium]
MKLVRPFQKKLYQRFREKAPLIQILIGPRQVGKTTAAQEIYRQWQGHKLMIAADSPTPPPGEWIKWNWEKALAMGPDTLLIIDEVQKVTGWNEIVKSLFDQERGKGNLKVLLLGSSSLYLQKGISESLAGRFELTRASHWTYGECKDYFSWSIEDYLQFGGYPGAAPFIKDHERWQSYILNSIIEPVLSRDIQGQQNIRNPALFRQTFELIMRYPSQIVSLQKLLGQLQDKGNAATIKHYLNLFEKCFLIRCLEKFSGSHVKTKASSPKITILNPALISAYQPRERLRNDRGWYGHILETVIGFHLTLLPNSELFYWKHGNFEVDYILKTPKETVAIEIKSGHEKTSAGLKEFSKRYPKIRCELWDHGECKKFISSNI